MLYCFEKALGAYRGLFFAQKPEICAFYLILFGYGICIFKVKTVNTV